MKDLTERKAVYLDDAIEAIVGCTNCGTEDELRAYAARHSLENLWTGGIVDAIDAIKRLPSSKPEIIRCKECKEFRRWIDTDITFCDRTESEVKEDDFCSRAERREDD